MISKISRIIERIVRKLFRFERFSSSSYWIGRYESGGGSGAGSYNKFADFKASVINDFVAKRGVASVIEFGCGDGHQLKSAVYPRYIGFDISKEAIRCCSSIFSCDSTKEFRLAEEYRGERAELSMSLDVIYHLVEDEVFEEYMRRLFSAADRFVIIYSSNTNQEISTPVSHVRHRKFSDWISENEPYWELVEEVENAYPYNGNHHDSSFANFFIYAKKNSNKSRLSA